MLNMKEVRRIVVKVGSSTLTYDNGKPNIRRIEQLVRTISDLQNRGFEMVLVSSGAVAVGTAKLGLKERPRELAVKQAAAAVGQCELMYIYDKLYSQYHHVVAQLLITADDIETPERAKNFHNTLARLLQLRTLPIINENDTVATQELGIGDNDTLAAIVARTIRADLLILFSDIDGLFTADPHSDPAAKLIPVVERLTPEIERLACGAGSKFGTGGMQTKLHAAHIATEAGVPMVIANGAQPAALYDLMDGKPVGTKFLAQEAEA